MHRSRIHVLHKLLWILKMRTDDFQQMSAGEGKLSHGWIRYCRLPSSGASFADGSELYTGVLSKSSEKCVNSAESAARNPDVKIKCQASVPRDAFPPTPPGPEGSNGNGLLRVQWVAGAWLNVFSSFPNTFRTAAGWFGNLGFVNSVQFAMK